MADPIGQVNELTRRHRAPLDTIDQRAVERLALSLRDEPELVDIFTAIEHHWRAAVQPDGAHIARLAHEYEQAVFCALMNAANDDPQYPRLHAFGRLEHNLDGVRVPATKSGHPNPDYFYRFAPIEGGTAYVIKGKIAGGRPTAFEVSILTAAQVYQGNLSLDQLQVDTDGCFDITIDAEPAGERQNHFQSNAESVQILIRDVIADASRENPISLTIERLGPPPTRPERTFGEVAASIERHLRKHVDDLIYVTDNFIRATPANSFAPPEIKSGSMYSVAQAYSPGNFAIEVNQALIINLTLGAARYAVVPITDYWGGLGRFLEQPVYVGTGNAVPNRDGSFTFVVAHQDPGVANWVNPDSLTQGSMFIRWIGFGSNATDAPISLSVQPVAFDDIDHHLSADTPRLTPDERTKKHASWRKHYQRVAG